MKTNHYLSAMLLLPGLLMNAIPVQGQMASQGQGTTNTNISLVTSGQEIAGVSFQFNGVNEKETNISGTTYSIYNVSEGTPILEAGAPDLQKVTSSVIIPDEGATALSIKSSSYTEYQNVAIAPSKGSLLRNQSPSAIPYHFGSVYQQDQFYPGKLAELTDPYILRDHRGQTIITYPFQYNPVTKVLRIYDEITVGIAEAPGNGINNLKKKGNEKLTKEFEKIYQNRFVNYSSVASQKMYTPVSEDGRMLIICHDALANTMAPFVEWKNQKGIPTEMVNTSITGMNESSLNYYIANYYATYSDLVFVLLVGDHAQVNTNDLGMTWAGETKWSDSKYGFLAGSDHYPEIFVGRFSTDNATDLTTMVNRVLEYEKDPAAGDWMSKAVGIASDEGPGDDGEDDWEHMRNIRTDLMNYNYTEVFEFYDGSHGGEDAAGNPSTNDVALVINDGIGLFNYCGHGDQNSCVTSNYNSNAVNSATNNGKYPFVVSVACNNGTFAMGDCMGEIWMKATNNGSPTGSIACCASTILMAWSEPMAAQDEIVDILVESYTNNIKRTIGGLFYNGEMQMLDDYPTSNSSGMEVMETWLLFGDPSTVIRTAVPTAITGSHNSSVNMSATSINVASNTEGALVCITQNNVILGTGIISGGSATVTYNNPSTQDDLLVTITGYNGIPYQGNVNISSCAGPAANYGFSLNNLVAAFTDASTGTGGTLGYSWDFGDGAGTSTETSPTYTYASTGTYNVCLTVTDSCGNDQKCKNITITNSVGIESLDERIGLNVYPNPMGEQSAVVFNLEATEEIKLTVFDLLGQETKVLLREVMPAGEHAITLNAADYEKAMYFIRLETSGKVLTKRFVVQ